ncbi:DNA-formamidopyrimidine glycosylase [Candidatus Dojkabacteria bacterium]|uniref:DNA-formamidopyrimidine glycosylase n=1 Tax=Candidatus Dojkabacteria bacterium TaxID=2099670 RepID=A0A955RIW6_9BACT|nr:DNA-formamidopyrimidine glycosylase [Candidatus Dojkabacteria bacterium]
MPELPEVHTFITQIKPFVLSKTIKSFTVTKEGLRLIAPIDPKLFSKEIIGKQITDITRHGKFIIFHLNDGSRIVAHLRMSGRFIVTDEPFEHKHNRLQLEFEEGGIFNFIDIRRFATFEYINPGDNHKGLSRLGPDALADSFDSKYLSDKLKNRKKNIYSSLMDQSVVAGIGNIYANEILHRALLSPTLPSDQVPLITFPLIVDQTKEVLNMAITHKGTTLIDKSYKDMHGGYGEFNVKLKVYAREDEPCFSCNAPIKKIRIQNRSVYYCPNCQA